MKIVHENCSFQIRLFFFNRRKVKNHHHLSKFKFFFHNSLPFPILFVLIKSFRLRSRPTFFFCFNRVFFLFYYADGNFFWKRRHVVELARRHDVLTVRRFVIKRTRCRDAQWKFWFSRATALQAATSLQMCVRVGVAVCRWVDGLDVAMLYRCIHTLVYACIAHQMK